MNGHVLNEVCHSNIELGPNINRKVVDWLQSVVFRPGDFVEEHKGSIRTTEILSSAGL